MILFNFCSSTIDLDKLFSYHSWALIQVRWSKLDLDVVPIGL
jgi:hypothetical protein